MNINFDKLPFFSAIRDWSISLPKTERQYIIRQIQVVLGEYYVHLPIKMKAFSIDPIGELEVLLQEASTYNSNTFSFLKKIMFIIIKLRDRHTTLLLPYPWNKIIVFLPFVIEIYYQNEFPVYVISKILYPLEENDFRVGSIITHWNGIPIANYIEIEAMKSQGANAYAAKKLTLANLTIKSLAYSLPPDEDWVHCSYINPKSGKIQTSTFFWKFYMESESDNQKNQSSLGTSMTLFAGIDYLQLKVNSLMNRLIVNNSQLEIQKLSTASYDNILKYRSIKTSHGEVGYLRIFSWDVTDINIFIKESIQLLQSFPQNYLIIDIRNNPGGLIPAGEKFLQLLTNKPIQSLPVQFRNTNSNRNFGNLREFSVWKESFDLMNLTNETYTQAFSLTDLTEIPEYTYPGKIALIIDSLTYSTSDFFASGFKENEIGLVFGTEEASGGGGANVWTNSTLINLATLAKNTNITTLPQGMNLNISMRRALKIGKKTGLPIENFGTPADYVHKTTLNDLLNNNIDLINFVIKRLMGSP